MMTQHETQLLWTQPEWLDQANAWIRTELERNNLNLLGPIEQPHVRPWSTVLRAPTSGGDMYFKAVPPLLTHEIAITEA